MMLRHCNTYGRIQTRNAASQQHCHKIKKKKTQQIGVGDGFYCRGIQIGLPTTPRTTGQQKWRRQHQETHGPFVVQLLHHFIRHPSDGRFAIGHHQQKLVGRFSGTLKGHSRGHWKKPGPYWWNPFWTANLRSTWWHQRSGHWNNVHCALVTRWWIHRVCQEWDHCQRALTPSRWRTFWDYQNRAHPGNQCRQQQ